MSSLDAFCRIIIYFLTLLITHTERPIFSSKIIYTPDSSNRGGDTKIWKCDWIIGVMFWYLWYIICFIEQLPEEWDQADQLPMYAQGEVINLACINVGTVQLQHSNWGSMHETTIGIAFATH